MVDRPADSLRSLLCVSVAPRAWLGERLVLETAADAVIVDLIGADATNADLASADAARVRARDAIAAAGDRLRVFVRVGGVVSGRLAEDLAALLPARPFGVMLSDVAGPADVEQLGARLRVSEAELGRADGGTRVIPVIGAPAGVLALSGSAWPAGRIAAYAWEPPRLPGPPPPAGRLNDAARLVRSLTILAAARDGVPAIDPPGSDATDDAFRHACLAALNEGVGGCIVRTEAQAGIANAAFAAGRDRRQG